MNTIFSAHISSFKIIWKPSNSLPFEFSKDICIGSKNSAEAKICESDHRRTKLLKTVSVLSKLRYQCGRNTLCKPIIEDSVR